jgi:hypothetical protein
MKKPGWGGMEELKVTEMMFTECIREMGMKGRELSQCILMMLGL